MCIRFSSSKGQVMMEYNEWVIWVSFHLYKLHMEYQTCPTCPTWQLGHLQMPHIHSHVSCSSVSNNTFVMSGHILKIKLERKLLVKFTHLTYLVIASGKHHAWGWNKEINWTSVTYIEYVKQLHSFKSHIQVMLFLWQKLYARQL